MERRGVQRCYPYNLSFPYAMSNKLIYCFDSDFTRNEWLNDRKILRPNRNWNVSLSLAKLISWFTIWFEVSAVRVSYVNKTTISSYAIRTRFCSIYFRVFRNSQRTDTHWFRWTKILNSDFRLGLGARSKSSISRFECDVAMHTKHQSAFNKHSRVLNWNTLRKMETKNRLWTETRAFRWRNIYNSIHANSQQRTELNNFNIL